jgi:hypothetical protein
METVTAVTEPENRITKWDSAAKAHKIPGCLNWIQVWKSQNQPAAASEKPHRAELAVDLTCLRRNGPTSGCCSSNPSAHNATFG